jgi:hypothetical protein
MTWESVNHIICNQRTMSDNDCNFSIFEFHTCSTRYIEKAIEAFIQIASNHQVFRVTDEIDKIKCGGHQRKNALPHQSNCMHGIYQIFKCQYFQSNGT